MEKQCTENAVPQFKSALVHDLTKRALVKMVRLSFPFFLSKLILFTANKPLEYFLYVFIHKAALQILDTRNPFHFHNFPKYRELLGEKCP